MRLGLKRFSINLFIKIALVIIGIFSASIIANSLLPLNYGYYSFLFSLVSIFSGTYNSIISSKVIKREIILKPKSIKTIINNVVIIKLSFYFIFSIPIYFILNLLVKNNLLTFILMFLIMNEFLSDFLEQVYFTIKKTLFLSIIRLILSTNFLLLILYFNNFEIITLIIIQSFSLFLFNIIIFIHFNLSFQNEKKEKVIYLVFLRDSLSFMWISLLGIASTYLPVIFLNFNFSSLATAFYSIASKILSPLGIISVFIMNYSFPFFMKIYSVDFKKFVKYIINTFTYIIFLGSISVPILSLLINYGITTFFDSSYIDSIIIFRFEIWFTLLLLIDLFIGMILNILGKYKILALFVTIDTLILLPLLFFVSFRGVYILSITKLLITFFFTFYHVIILLKLVSKINITKISIFMVFTLFFILTNLYFNNIFVLILAYIIYGIYFLFFYRKVIIKHDEDSFNNYHV